MYHKKILINDVLSLENYPASLFDFQKSIKIVNNKALADVE